MKSFFLNESLTWRRARNQRIIAFLRIIAYLAILQSGIWILLMASAEKYLIMAGLVMMLACGFQALRLIKKNKLLQSKFLLTISWGGYFLFVCAFASGYGINNGTTHFGFILVGIVSYFLFLDLRIIREIISVFFFSLFLCYHFGYAPFYPVILLDARQSFIIPRVDMFSILLSIFLITRFFVLEINKSEEALAVSADQLEGMIHGILPKAVVERIQKEGKTFADQYDDCSVLFADISHFTEWSEKQTPYEVVNRLNDIFSRFDTAVEKRNLTKIKTIGDAYMVVAGIPEYRKDHATVLTELALEFIKIADEHGEFKFRIGINSGPAVAGIIGKKTFLFDVWGDTVNIASRMESSGEPGKINISRGTYEKINKHYACTPRGKIAAKNKGEIDMYFVEG